MLLVCGGQPPAGLPLADRIVSVSPAVMRKLAGLDSPPSGLSTALNWPVCFRYPGGVAFCRQLVVMFASHLQRLICGFERKACRWRPSLTCRRSQTSPLCPCWSGCWCSKACKTLAMW